MLKFSSYAAGALLAAIATPSMAADLIITEPEVPVALPAETPMTGLYVGVNLGEAFQGLWFNDVDFDPPQDYLFSKESLTAGISVGYDLLLTPNVVAGIELRYDHFGAEFEPFEDPLSGNVLATIEDSTTAAVKLGYRVDNNTQIYGIVGGGFTRVSAFEGFGFDEVTEGVGGYVLGVGIETRLMDSVTASLDARYFRATDTFTTADGYEFEPRYFAVTAGLKYRFGGNMGFGAPETIVDPVDYDFSGPRLSLAVLGGAGSMERDIATPGADVGPFWSEGVGASIGAGFDFAIADDWVIGLDASLDYLPMTFEDPDQDNPDVGATTEFATVDSVVALGARVGAKLNPSTLLYGKVGIASIHTTANEDFFATAGGGDEWLPGYQVGVGIETAINETMTLGVEGVYTAATDSLTTDNTQLGQVELQPSLLTGKVSLNFRF